MSNAAVRWVETERERERVRMPDALANRQLTRFIWQPREDIPHAEVLGAVIERCRVIPVVKLLRWDRIEDIPLEHREPGMMRRDNEGKWAYAAYSILPGFILEAILDQYRGHGVVELTALRGMNAGEFAALRIDDLFFPERKSVDDGIDQTPQTYADMRLMIESRMHAAQINGLGYSGQQLDTLQTCASEMLRAINIASRYDTALVDESEGELELGRNNPHYKQKYDAADLAALRRIGRPRKDAFMKRLAEQQFDLQATVREAIVEKQGQATNIRELAEAVGTSVATAMAAEFGKLFASQRGMPWPPPGGEVVTPAGDAEPPKAPEPDAPKPTPQVKPPKFQQTK